MQLREQVTKPRDTAVAVAKPVAVDCLAQQRDFAAAFGGQLACFGGDVLRIKVYGDETVTGSYKVDDAGTVSMPLVGQLRVAGKTTSQAAATIAAALANGFIRAPDVAVEVETYRPFFIQGAVKGGGQFAYVSGMTVRAAVSTAGGYSDTANRLRATIYRKVGEQMQKSVVDLDFPIYPGDTIVISERWL